jgi:glycosyltransferase involved in cell wall biosynthesis
VLFLLNSLTGGGSQRKTIRVANALVDEGYSVLLYYLDRREELLPSLRPSPRLHIECLDRAGRFDYRAMNRFRRRASESPDAAIVAINPYQVFFAARSLRGSRRDCGFIAATNTYTFASRKEAFLFHVFEKRPYRDADVVLFGSHAQKTLWCRSYSIDPERATVIYNGVDVDYFSPDAVEPPRASRTADDALTIIVVASLTPHKRHVDVLEAVRLLRTRSREISVVFAGDGPLASFIADRTRGMGLGDRVTFTGFVHDVRPLLKRADVAVLASNAVETFSNAILESMAMGKPVIASNIGGAAEQISDGVNGLLFEAGNVVELADCIDRMYDREFRLQAGAASRRSAVERFGLDKMVASYKQLLSQASLEHGIGDDAGLP